jgi:hypothetical protein
MAAAKKATTPTSTRATPAPAPTAPIPRAAVIPQPTQIQAPQGRAVALGRDGKPIWRNAAVGGADPYAIDPSIVPPGWVYEWKRYAVAGQVDHNYQAQLARVGRWIPVLAENHDGVFLPPGSKGSIIIDGLILMERPVELHNEARREMKADADSPMLRARKERGLQIPSGVTGVSTETAAAQQASFVNTTRVYANQEDVAALNEIPRQAYDYESNTID